TARQRGRGIGPAFLETRRWRPSARPPAAERQPTFRCRVAPNSAPILRMRRQSMVRGRSRRAAYRRESECPRQRREQGRKKPWFFPRRPCRRQWLASEGGEVGHAACVPYLARGAPPNSTLLAFDLCGAIVFL